MTSFDQKTFPPVVYVPCEQSGSSDEDLRIDLRRTGDGRSALLVYSALDRLVNCCGEYQPWVVMPTVKLGVVAEHVRFDVILLDLEIPERLRRGGGGAR
ncbi:MAG: SAV_915 family protein [Pseudonocardiaceae bacterium]